MNELKTKNQMNVNNTLVKVMKVNGIDYISLTDLAKYQNSKDPSGVIRNWMSNKNSFEFYSLWEKLHNEKTERGQITYFVPAYFCISQYITYFTCLNGWYVIYQNYENGRNYV